MKTVFRSLVACLALWLMLTAGPSAQLAISPAPTSIDLQTYTTTGAATWTKLAGAKSVDVILIAGGGGGGSGRKGAAGGIRSGGSGGGAGARAEASFPAALLGATESITIGAGSAGGVAISASDTNGNNGTAGLDSKFGVWLLARGGNFGLAGTATGAAGGAPPYDFPDQGGFFSSHGSGGAASATGLLGADGVFSMVGGGGGAAGGGITTGNVASAGGVGGIQGAATLLQGYAGYGVLVAGGTTGAANTAGGAGAAVTTNLPFGGSGGGGGGSSTSTNGGAGGAGGKYGAGGGGGGAADNAVGNSGAGGIGGDGIVVVITHF